MQSTSRAFSKETLIFGHEGRLARLQRKTRRRPAFTLVEMLVVITIIGILVALLIPTIAGVMRRTRVAAVGIELQDLTRAIESYKLKNGDYPPDFTKAAAVTAHIARAYPRNSRNITTWLTSTVQGRSIANLDPAEAIVFWLAMVSTNPRDPLAPSIDPASYFSFDESRLTCPLFPISPVGTGPDIDGDWWPEYLPKHGNQAPYVYFDGRLISGAFAYTTTRYPVATNSPLINTLGETRPYRSTNLIDVRDSKRTQPQPANLTNTSDPQYPNRTQWMNPGKFQVICGGLDNNYGKDLFSNNVLIFKQFPVPNYQLVGSVEEDNMADFSEMKSLGDAVP